MQIKSVEALKSWLTTRLESVCDADPAALAKYVVALVKKDKPMQELKDICIDQLEVFLSDETASFVNVLFEALTNSSYIPQALVEPAATPHPVPAPPLVLPPQPTPTSTTTQEKPRKISLSEDVLTTRVLAEPDDDDRDFKRTRRTTDCSDRSTSGASSVVSSSGDRSRKRRADDDRSRGDYPKIPKEEHGVMRRGDSEPHDEQVPRNKPDAAAPYDNNAIYPIPSAVLRDRVMKHGPDGQDVLLRPGLHSHDDPRARRGSPSRDRRGGRMGRGRNFRDRYRDDRPRHERRDDRDRNGARKSRCRDYDEKGFCMRGELCPFDHGNDPVVVQDVLPPMLGFPPSTGPSFLPEGQPIPGATIPGNAVPIPGGYPTPTSQPPPPGTTVPLPTDDPKSKANQKGPDTTVPVSGPRPPAPTGMVPQLSQAPVMPPHAVHIIRQPMLRGQAPPRFVNPFEDSYNPEQPQFDRTPVWMRLGNGRPPRPPHPLPPRGAFHPTMGLRSRELLAVSPNPAQLTVRVPGISAPRPVVPAMPDRIVVHSDPANNAPVPPQEQLPPQPQPPAAPQQDAVQPPVNHTAPVKNRLGFPRKLSDTLELKKIPRDLNNIAKLNEHFQRFGTITNIQVCAFGDPEAALVQFSHHSEAKAAYSCPDAVLANRFIRVFWHNPDRQQNNKDGNSIQGAAAKGTSNSGSTPAESTAKEDTNKVPTETKAKPTMFQSGKTTFSKNAKPLPVHVPVRPALTKRQQELQKQEAIKKKLEIQKQKQELLNKQIKEQKLLISKLEKKNLSAAEKDLIMKTIKSLSSNIEGLRKEVELAAMAAKSKESPSQARQIAQKAILDQELDLITHQNTGEDTTELKKKVEELKQEAKSLGLLDPPTKGRGRGSLRGRGRGTPVRSRPLPRTTRVWTRDSASLDHRPKQITVGEITPEQKEDIAEHFKEFGIVDSEEYIEDKNVLNLTFRTRKEAEIAYNKGKTFKGRALKVSWYRTPVPPTSPAAAVKTPTTPTVLKKVEEELGLDIDAELGKHEFDAEADEALLLGEDFDEEEEEEDERSWKR